MPTNPNKTRVRRSTLDDTPSDAVVTDSEREDRSAVVRGADWLLARLPYFKYRYLAWSHTKRIIVGYLMWLVVLPIIPIGLLIFWYAHDPEGFRKSPVTALLTGLLLAWIGGAGWVAGQTPITDGTPYANVKSTADGETNAVNNDPAAVPSQTSKDNIASQTKSKETGGRQFENCTAAFEAGVFDIKRSDPSYERRLDRDNDGIACEK